MKWIAEYFLAACALHEAWTSADILCLLPAASADTANDATRAVASVEISSFFMSYLLCSQTSQKRQFTHFRSEYFPVILFRNNPHAILSVVDAWEIAALAVRIDRCRIAFATIVFSLINEGSCTHYKQVHLPFKRNGIFECNVVPNLPATSDSRLAVKNSVAFGSRYDNPIMFAAEICRRLVFRKSDRLH